MLIEPLWTKFKWNFHRCSYIFIQENVFDNAVCELVTILSQRQCVPITLSGIGNVIIKIRWLWDCLIFIVRIHLLLTLSVRGPSYLGLTRSISWLLMPWLLTSPGHQQPWYWLYRICRSFSYLRKCFKYLCQINVEEWHKMQIYVYVPSEKFST